MYIVGCLGRDVAVANQHHPPPNSFNMCQAAHGLQLSQILEYWNEVGHCCATTGEDTLLCKENLKEGNF